MSGINLQIGIGGIFSGMAYTYDFFSKEHSLRPYISKILGRDFKYGLKREFISKSHLTSNREIKYSNHPMYPVIFENLERYVIYEYRRFAGDTFGEIQEGYFVILSDCIKELEQEEVLYWCGTAREKEKLEKAGRQHFGDHKKYAPEDIDF